MTPAQLKRFLREAGLSQRGAARELAISERNMRRYIAGHLPVPRVIEYALRWLASQRAKTKQHKSGAAAAGGK